MRTVFQSRRRVTPLHGIPHRRGQMPRNRLDPVAKPGWGRLAARALLLVSVWAVPLSACAQVVAVSLELDSPRVAVGQSTVLRAYARIDPARLADTDRIFWWHVDLLNETPDVAQPDSARLERPFSDNDLGGSSSGTSSGPNRVGIYDSYANLPRAGWSNKVELFRLPVTAANPGTAIFRLRAGTGSGLFTSDFLVAPDGGGAPLRGGDYARARAVLEVTGGLALSIAPVFAANRFDGVRLSFPTQTGRDFVLEFKENLATNVAWQTWPGAPHNTGSVRDTNRLGQRFYRVRSVPGSNLAVSIVPVFAANRFDGVQLGFPTQSGRNFFLEFKENLATNVAWQTWPGGPHNSGSVRDTNRLVRRFYRVKSVPQ